MICYSTIFVNVHAKHIVRKCLGWKTRERYIFRKWHTFERKHSKTQTPNGHINVGHTQPRSATTTIHIVPRIFDLNCARISAVPHGTPTHTKAQTHSHTLTEYINTPGRAHDSGVHIRSGCSGTGAHLNEIRNTRYGHEIVATCERTTRRRVSGRVPPGLPCVCRHRRQNAGPIRKWNATPIYLVD